MLFNTTIYRNIEFGLVGTDLENVSIPRAESVTVVTVYIAKVNHKHVGQPSIWATSNSHQNHQNSTRSCAHQSTQLTLKSMIKALAPKWGAT